MNAHTLTAEAKPAIGASEVDFASIAHGLTLSWRDLASPPVDYFADGPNMHPDIDCWVDPVDPGSLQISQSSQFWATGFRTEHTRHVEALGGSSVADALEAVDRFASRSGIGPACAFAVSWAPGGEQVNDGMRPFLSVWCGQVLDVEEIPVTPRTTIPLGARVRSGSTLSLRVGQRRGHPDEVLDEHYRFVLEQDEKGEWTLNSGPMSAGREVHAHRSGFQYLGEVVEWARSLWARSFPVDEHFDASSTSVSIGVPIYRLRNYAEPAFRVYVY